MVVTTCLANCEELSVFPVDLVCCRHQESFSQLQIRGPRPTFAWFQFLEQGGNPGTLPSCQLPLWFEDIAKGVDYVLPRSTMDRPHVVARTHGEYPDLR